MPVFSVYLIPDQTSSFYQICSSLIGYDVYGGSFLPPFLSKKYGQETMENWVGIARLFGCHITLGEAVSYAAETVDEVHTRLEWVAQRVAPFDLTSGRFKDSMRMAPRAIQTTFDDATGATYRLHELVLTSVLVLHAGSPFFEPNVHTFSAADQRAFYRYGVPRYRLLENFDLHASLASNLPDWPTLRRVQQDMHTGAGLFRDEEQRTFHVDALYLVEQQDNRHFRVVARFPLRGGA